MGKRAFGWDSDLSAIGPKAHLGSAIINWEPYYKTRIQAVLDNTWKSQPEKIWWGVKEGAIDFVSVAADVPQATKDKLDKVKAGLKDGSNKNKKNPNNDNTGKE